MMPRLTVALKDKTYPIFIESGALASVGAVLTPLARGKKAVIVTDTTVASLYADTVAASFVRAGVDVRVCVVPASETAKSFDVLEKVVRFFLQNGVDRNSFAVALGGGVIGDLTGFAASMVLRGIDFFQIPTTLLAQVDSSVGGKTAIDTDEGKNLIGAFYQPKGVFIDPAVLKTLPVRQRIAGYAEVVKYGLIVDEGFWRRLYDGAGKQVVAGDMNACAEAIETCCALKARVVADDEKETTGARALLNFGHTFGHALEAESGFALLHGEAVALGMMASVRFSVGHCGLSETDASAIESHFLSVGLPVRSQIAYCRDALMRRMYADKKTTDGALNLIVLSRIGCAEMLKNAAVRDVTAVWDAFLKKTKG